MKSYVAAVAESRHIEAFYEWLVLVCCIGMTEKLATEIQDLLFDGKERRRN